VISALFSAIFKILPDARIRWRHVGTGAIFTAMLFAAGKSAIGWHLSRKATTSTYGTAGALALVLL
jgi:membrane protein